MSGGIVAGILPASTRISPSLRTINLSMSMSSCSFGISGPWPFISVPSIDESLRFICVRKYVGELEKVVLKLYDILKKYGENNEKTETKRATTIYLGDTSKNKQEINKSPYWSNLYGKDGDVTEIDEIIQKKGEYIHKMDLYFRIKKMKIAKELYSRKNIIVWI